MLGNPITTEETTDIILLLHEGRIIEAKMLFNSLCPYKHPDAITWFETYCKIADSLKDRNCAEIPQIIANIFGMN